MQKHFIAACCLVMLLCCGDIFAQTTVNYNFEGADRSSWTFVNGSVTNKWCISKNTNAQNGGTYSLYVTNGTGGLQTGTTQDYAYTISSSSVVWAYMDITFPVTTNDFTFSFDWKCYGESSLDFFSAYLGPTTSTVTAGTTLTAPTGAVAFVNTLRTSNNTYFNDYNGSAYMTTTASNVPWRTFSTTLDAATYSGQTKRLFFAWKNDGSVGAGYPAAIDNIKLIYTQPTCDETITLSSNLSRTINCNTTYCFYDSGGASGNYGNSQDYTATFTSNGAITITFESFATQSTQDYLTVYDGNATTGIVLIQNASGTTVPAGVTAVSGTMTVVWHSNQSQNNTGWKAYITGCGYVDPCPVIGATETASSSGIYGGIYTWGNSYAYTQQVYLASELLAAGVRPGVLESIALNYAETTASSLTFEVYIGQTSQSTVPTSWITDAGLTLAYAGTISFTTGWNTIDVSGANFVWDGSSNIVLAFRRTSSTSGAVSYPDFYYTSSTGMVAYYTSSSSVTLNGSNVATSSGTATAQRPNVKFCIDDCTQLTGTFSLSQSSAVVMLGQTLNLSTLLTNSLSPAGTVSYTSSATGVANVNSSGVVTGVSTGSATITITYTPNNPDYCSRSLTFAVNVSDGCPVIGEGSSCGYTYGPVNNFYHYGYYQYIFPLPDYSAGGDITSIAFQYCYTTAMTDKTNVNIYMGLTSNSTFASATSWIPLSQLTLVYSGPLNCTQGWNTYTLDHPFYFDGTSNLVVAIDDNSNAYDGSSYTFYYTSGTDNVTLYNYSDSSDPDPSNPPSGTLSANRPNVKFCIENCTPRTLTFAQQTYNLTSCSNISQTPTISPVQGGAITYTSSNPMVATVSSAGVVTPISSGTTVITATVATYNGHCQASGSYTVNVDVSGTAHTLTYNTTANCSGTASAAPASVTGTSAIVTSTTPTCSGKYFIGWNTAIDGSGASYAAGATVDMACTNVTLYAQYSTVPPSITGSSDCENAMAFCASNEADAAYNLAISATGTDSIGGIGSYLTRNPTWWFLRISEPGPINMTIHSSCGDVDFGCWGPFDNVTCDRENDLTNGTDYSYYSGNSMAEYYGASYNGTTPTSSTTSVGTPINGTFALAVPCGNLVDYGGSSSEDEYLQIPNAQVGEIYIVVIANYAGCTGNITFEQSNISSAGAGRSDCTIVNDCAITNVTTNVGDCNGNQTFSVSGNIYFTDAPSDGTLIVSDGAISETFYPPFTSPLSYSLEGLTGDGQEHTITAAFSTSSVNCSKIAYIDAPTCEINCPDATVTLSGYSEQVGDIYYYNVCLNSGVNMSATQTGYTSPSWTWSVNPHHGIAPRILTGQSVSYTPTAEQGYDVSLTVAEGQCRTVAHARIRVSAGPQTDATSVDAGTICVGNTGTVTIGGAGSAIVVTDTTYDIESTLGRAGETFIPDGPNCTDQCYTSSVTFYDYEDGATVQNVDAIEYLRINMEHSFIGDIQIKLTCPSGRSAVILQDLYSTDTSNHSMYNSQAIDPYTYTWPDRETTTRWHIGSSATNWYTGLHMLGRTAYQSQNDSYYYSDDGNTYYLASFGSAEDANDFIENYLALYYTGNTYAIYSIGGGSYYAIAFTSGSYTLFVWLTFDNTTSSNAYSFPSQSAAQYFINNVHGGSGVASSYADLGAYNRIYFGEPDIYDVVDGANLSTSQICDGDDAHNLAGIGYDYAWTSNSNYNTVGYVYDVANMSSSTTLYNNGTASTNTLHHVIPSDVEAGTHIYQPFNSFSNFIGCPLNGTWTISVCDSWAKDNGYIFNWELALDPALLPNDWSYTVGLESVTVDCGSMVAVSGNDVVITPESGSTMPSTCNITLHDRYGCETVVPLTFNVVEPTIVLTSGANDQEVCEGMDIENIVYTIGGSASSATAFGLPDGVTLTVSGTTATISGAPTTAGRYNYTIYTESGDALHCEEVYLSGSIVVNVGNIVPEFDQAGPYCEGTTVAALPTTSTNGISGTWSPRITNETNRYTFTPNPGQCATTTTMDITVNPLPTLEYTSGSETLCANIAPTSNIVFTFGGGANGADVTGLPAGMEFNIVGSTVVISGTPTASGTFPYVVTTTGAVSPCENESLSRTITVNESPTLVLRSGSNNQTVCAGSAIESLVYAYGGGATGANATMPAGLTQSLNTTDHTLTISGTPTASGTITVVTTGVNAPCEDRTLSATITVNEQAQLDLASASSDVDLCREVPWSGNIQYTFGGSATGANVTGLPLGVTYSVSGTTVTISGNPTDEAGSYTYTVTTTGAVSPCENISLTGIIRVSENATLELTSAAGTDDQSICLPGDFEDIEYTFGGGATSVDLVALNNALPNGVTASVNTVAQTVIISGTPTETGTFLYAVTTTGSVDPCKSETMTGTIVVNRMPELIATGNDNQNFCFGNAMTDLVFTYGGGATSAVISGTMPAGVSISYGTNTMTLSGTPTETGDFNFSVVTTGAAGTCTNVELPVSIKVFDNPTVGITSTATQICNGSTATLTSNPASFQSYAWTCETSSNATYTITSGMPATTTGSSIEVNPTVTPGSTNITYALTVSDANGCTANVEQSIIVSDIPEAEVSVTPNTKCEVPYNGTITVGNFSGALTGGTYTIFANGETLTSTGANVVFDGLTPGDYVVRVSSESTSDNCYSEYNVTIGDEPTHPTVAIVGQLSICDNTSTTLTAHADDGLGTFTYLWSDNSTAETLVTPNLTSSTMYYVLATDENGCTAYNEVTVAIGDTPEVSATATSPICLGKNTILQAAVSNAGSGYTLEWTANPSENSGLPANSTGARITVTPTAQGTYNYQVKLTTSSCNDGNDYVVYADVDVVVNPLPTPGITNNTGTQTMTCDVTSISLTATGGTSYAWSNNINVAANTISTTGTYTVTVTDANSCSATTTIAIDNDVTQPQVAITEPATRILTCDVQSIALNVTSTTLGTTFDWSSQTVTTPGTYTVVATGPNGCENSASIEITRDVALPTVGINNPATTILTCANPEITLTAYGTGTLSWTTQTVDHEDTYEVVATAANGCSATASIYIGIDKAAPTVGITSSGDILSCRIQNVTLTASGARTYIWSDANSSAGTTLSVTTPGTYYVTGTGTNGCTAETLYTINPDYDLPNVSIVAPTNTLTCDVRSIALTAQTQTPGTTFDWTTRTVSTPGTYTVVATGPNGCTASADFEILQNVDLPDVGITATDTMLTCNNPTITLTGSGTGSLSWASGSLDVTTPGVYTLIASGDNGCSNTDQITIYQNISTPNVSLLNNTGTDILTCDIRSISVSVEDDSDADVYVWSAGGENTTGTGNAFTAPGTYYVTATAPNGCESIASITIGQDIVPPTVSITNNTGTNTLTCDLTQISVTAVGSATVDNYQWSQGTTQMSANNTLVTIGTYVVTATATNGCTATAQIIIDESVNRPNIDFINVTGTTVLTCDVTYIEVTATGTGASYQWSGGSSPSTANNRFDAIGTYYVTATGDNGCTNSKPFSITENIVPPTVTITNESGFNEINCNHALVNVTAVQAGSVPIVSYLWSNGVDVAANTFTTPGTYTVSATANNGCESTANVVITEDHNPPRPSILSANGIYIIDCAHPSLILNATGGVSYLWTPGGQTTSEIAVTTPGTYVVEATGTNGCTATTSVEIGINTEPPAVAINNITGEDQINCNVTNIHIIAQGGYIYSWDNSLWGGGAEQYITEAGLYSVTVTARNGCTASAAITITQDTDPPTLQANSTTGFYELNCNVPQITVNATGNGESYAWSGGTNPTGSTNVFTSAGIYTVTSTGFNGCTSSVSVQQITTNYTAPTISIVDQLGTAVQVVTLNCTNPEATLTVQSNGIAYTWNDYQTSSSRTFTQQGVYTVTVTGSNGCNTAASVEIREDFATPAAQIVNSSNATELTCTTSSITLSANGGAGATYLWSNGSSSRTITVTTPDRYTVVVTGTNGCTNSNYVDITQAPVFDASITNVGTISCNGGSTSATVTATGGNPGYHYTWNDGQTSATANNLVAGAYTVTVRDNGGCSAVLSCSINQPQPLVVGLNPHDLYCGVSLGSIDAAVTGGTQPYTYMWSSGSSATSLSNLNTGTYGLSVTDANGCVSSSTATIRMLGMLAVNASVTHAISCYGLNDGVVAATCENGAAPLMYSWSTGHAVYEVNNMFAGSYQVTVTDAWGCSGQSSVTLVTPSAMVVEMTPVSPKCYNTHDGQVNVLTTGGVSPYTYAWNNASTSQTLTNVAAGTYSLTITDAAGCSTSRNVTIDAPDAIAMEVVVTDVKCYGDRDGKVEVTANGGTEPYRYSVERILELSTSSLFTNIGAGYYNVRVTDANGCEVTKSAVVKQPEEIKVEAVTEDPFCKNSRTGWISVSAIGGVVPYQYYWDNYMSDSSLMLNIPEGQYTVGVVDANGCKSLNVKVTLVDVDVDCLRIPNVFTPNGDGINDEWIIANLNMFPEAQIYVFNRWGQLMYKTTGDGEPWDGSYRGHYVPAGTYIYVIDLFNDDEPYKGTVTIVY